MRERVHTLIAIACLLALLAAGSTCGETIQEETFLRQQEAFVRKALTLVTLYEKKGDLESARKLCEKLFSLQGDDLAVQKKLASLYRQEGRRQDVVELYSRLLAERPGDVAILTELARAQSEAGMEEEALATSAKVLAATGTAPIAALRVARTLQEARMFEQAAGVLTKAVEAHPRDPKLLCALARARLRAKDYRGAADAAERLIASARTAVFRRQGEFLLLRALLGGNLATQYLAEADVDIRGLERTYAKALLQLARALKDAGRDKEAREVLGRLKTMYPDSAEASEAARVWGGDAVASQPAASGGRP